MIRISANICKKVPIPRREFSSQSFGASLDVELSDADKPEAIQCRIRELYRLLSQAVDEQIAGATEIQQSVPANGYRTGVSNTRPPANGNGSNGRKTTATQAQCRAIIAICKSLNLEVKDVVADYNVTEPAQLPIKAASALIDNLKLRQNVNATPPH